MWESISLEQMVNWSAKRIYPRTKLPFFPLSRNHIIPNHTGIAFCSRSATRLRNSFLKLSTTTVKSKTQSVAHQLISVAAERTDRASRTVETPGVRPERTKPEVSWTEFLGPLHLPLGGSHSLRCQDSVENAEELLDIWESQKKVNIKTNAQIFFY